MVLCDVQFTEWLLPALWILHLNVFWFALLGGGVILEWYLFYDRVWGLRRKTRCPWIRYPHTSSQLNQYQAPCWKLYFTTCSFTEKLPMSRTKDPFPHALRKTKQQEDSVLYNIIKVWPDVCCVGNLKNHTGDRGLRAPQSVQAKGGWTLNHEWDRRSAFLYYCHLFSRTKNVLLPGFRFTLKLLSLQMYL